MKKKLLLFVSLILALSFSVFIACNDTTQNGEITFSGIQEVINIKLNDTDYDFLNGVSAKAGDADSTVTVDTSAIDFTKSGSYDVTYKAGDKTKTSTVKVFGAPVFTAADITINYGDDYKSGVSAKDSFDTALTVTEKTPPSTDALGRIEYKTHDVVFTATDAAGNVAEKTVKVTVSTTNRPTFAEKTIDLANTAESLGLTVGKDGNRPDAVEVYNTSTSTASKLTSADFTYSKLTGIVKLTNAYIAKLGASSTGHKIDIGYAGGYNTFVLKVTDTAEPAYTMEFDMSGDDFLVGEIDLPMAEKNANSAQNITVKYSLDKGKTGTYTAITEDDLTAVTFAEGNHSFKVEFERGGNVIAASTKVMDFKVMAEAGFYSRAIKGKKFVKYFKPIESTSGSTVDYDNSGEVDDDNEDNEDNGYIVLNNAKAEGTGGGNERGFIFDKNYLNGLKAQGYNILTITFKNAEILSTDPALDKLSYIDFWETDEDEFAVGREGRSDGGVDNFGPSAWNYWASQYRADVSTTEKTVTVNIKSTDTSSLMFLSNSSKTYIKSIVPSEEDFNSVSTIAAATEDLGVTFQVTPRDNQAKVARLTFFYNAADATLWGAQKTVNIRLANPIVVSGYDGAKIQVAPGIPGNETEQTDKAALWPFLEPGGRGARDGNVSEFGGKRYIQITAENVTNAETQEVTATVKVWYFNISSYELMVTISNLPKIEAGKAGIYADNNILDTAITGTYALTDGTAVVPTLAASDYAYADVATNTTKTSFSFTNKTFTINGDDNSSPENKDIRFFYNAVDGNMPVITIKPGAAIRLQNVENKSYGYGINVAVWGDQTNKTLTPNGKFHGVTHGLFDHQPNAYKDTIMNQHYYKVVITNGANDATFDLQLYDNATTAYVSFIQLTGLPKFKIGMVGMAVEYNSLGAFKNTSDFVFEPGDAAKPAFRTYYNGAYTDGVQIDFKAVRVDQNKKFKFFYNNASGTFVDAMTATAITMNNESGNYTGSDGHPYVQVQGENFAAQNLKFTTTTKVGEGDFANETAKEVMSDEGIKFQSFLHNTNSNFDETAYYNDAASPRIRTIRVLIYNVGAAGSKTAVFEMQYMRLDNSTYETVLKIEDLPELTAGYAGFIYNDQNSGWNYDQNYGEGAFGSFSVSNYTHTPA